MLQRSVWQYIHIYLYYILFIVYMIYYIVMSRDVTCSHVTSRRFTLYYIILFLKERIRNVTIRQQIGLEEPIIKETEQNQLKWYGHGRRKIK